MSQPVIVFSQPGGMFCQHTKEYLSQKGIKFSDRDVTKDASALDELRRLGAMTTPVTLIGSETVIGFDPEKIDKALAIS